MEPSDDRLSQLYHISIRQIMLRKEAFDYFSNLQENLERTGGLFSKMPSEIRGNITCLSDPGKSVIGYVEVSTIEHIEKYVPLNEGLYERPYTSCYYQITDDDKSTLPIYYIENGSPPLKAPEDCIDCRRKRKATKNKPDFWPTANL